MAEYSFDDVTSGRYFLALNRRIERMERHHDQLRLRYLEVMIPNPFPARAAVKETFLVVLFAAGLIVVPLLGIMWLDAPDGLGSVGEPLRIVGVGVAVLVIVQVVRVGQARSSHTAALRATWTWFNKHGWPPVTEVEEAGHRDTPPARLLELASSDDFDVLICVGENPRLPPQGLALLAAHPDSTVRLRPAWSSRTPLATLTTLTNDPDEGVAEAATKTLNGGR